jgi:light-independent protochlorophyllide reductase subunit B
MMGLEEHLIGMFRHDFEFVDGHRSHLGDGAPTAGAAGELLPGSPAAAADLPAPSSLGAGAAPATATATLEAPATGEPHWSPDGEAELAKIPFFVRGKVRRNTERFAGERGIALISAETLYDAKAHFSR